MIDREWIMRLAAQLESASGGEDHEPTVAEAQARGVELVMLCRDLYRAVDRLQHRSVIMVGQPMVGAEGNPPDTLNLYEINSIKGVVIHRGIYACVRDAIEAHLVGGGSMAEALLAHIDVRRGRFGSGERGYDFSGADFTGSRIGANWYGANLRGAVFREAWLCGSVFPGADLRNVDFVRAVLCDCDFRGAQLEGAVFDGARVEGAKLD